MAETDKLTWNCEMEVSLFHALRGHKPVGVNRHFQMLFILDKITSSYKKVTTKQIWDYLGELYDLQALNESEIVPFPNKESDFLLPGTDFSDMMQKAFPRFTQSKQEEVKSEKDTKAEKTSEKSDKNDKPESGTTKVKSESRQSLSAMATPDNSPKRKRTRNTPSTASPATPDAPPSKRRR